jgi:hypothetical protein
LDFSFHPALDHTDLLELAWDLMDLSVEEHSASIEPNFGLLINKHYCPKKVLLFAKSQVQLMT